ncbi:MAG TPA: NOB1 family endonuclease [Candidatus Methanoperedens sp.]|nr:NOB1 family endonuclease [Candidatus Methanoperedens sp.]
MIYIADSSLFIIGKRIEGIIITVPSVLDEIRDEKSRTIMELMNVRIEPVLQSFIREVISKARETKDSEELSRTDLDLLAKALEHTRNENTILVTDDYAVQNTAIQLGIKVMPTGQKKIKDVLLWEKFCIGCKRRFPTGDDCPVCGTHLKKMRK